MENFPPSNGFRSESSIPKGVQRLNYPLEDTGFMQQKAINTR